MARTIKLTSGSVLNGNPITLEVQPNVVTDTDSNKHIIYPSFHRVILEVECGMSGGDFETIKMSAPVFEESQTTSIQFDISSALRTFRDAYEYTPTPTTYPLVKFRVKAYDEYMLDGQVHPNISTVVYPADVDGKAQYLCTLFGAFSDYERLSGGGGGTMGLISLSRKPTSSPQLVGINSAFAYTPSYTTEQHLLSSAALVAPTSKEVTLTKEGLQNVEGQSVYVLSEDYKRQYFRFINSLGVLESVSLPEAYSKKFAVTSTPYSVSRQETFNRFSRSVIKKTNNKESWLFMTDALTEDWLSWYLHEFLMAEHIWINIYARWVPCNITVEDEITFIDRTKQDGYTLSFVVAFDVNGCIPA